MKDDLPGQRPSLQALLDERAAAKNVVVAEKVAEDEHIDMEIDMTDPEPEASEDQDEVTVPQTRKQRLLLAAGETPFHRALRKLELSWPPGRKEWILMVAGLVVLVGIVFGLTHHGKKTVPTVVKKANKVVVAKTVPSTLTGLPVDPAVNQRPVTAVMIENSLDARPQSGLGDAGVVFEAIAEGGITRFLALFQDTAPGNIGPIRSARPYYVQWAMGFDAGYAHVGGSPEALDDIKAWGVHDLDQFANGGSYHRVGDRAAPHNVYSSIDTLNQLETSKGYATSTYGGFTRKTKAASAKTITARTVDFNISGPDFNVHYEYDKGNNRYVRNEGGAPHIDANSNQQITPKVVIGMIVPYGLEADDHHSSYGVIGSGQVFVFQDGAVTTGTWSKDDSTHQIKFTDAAGKTLALDPGQTWITALGDAGRVSYAP